MGIFKKDELVLDFKGVRTEDMSSTVPYMRKLNTDAKVLVNQLNPKLNYNNKSLVLFNESDNYDMYKLFEKSPQTNNDNNFSETSPFISSDVYNQLLNKLKNKQSGGYRNEDKDEEESSTTSSESSESDKKKKKSIKKMFKKQDAEIDLEPEEEEEFSEMSAGSYVSSSAHTDGTETESAKFTSSASSNASSASSYASSNNFISSVSAKHTNREKYSDSVNTSDINIISIDN